ncbi:OpgC family protein [Rhodobacter ferrooxidans]|uniref:OpgC protein n=1 Tax=Rhodobacter ferrooxidans TaxID=371731 RepID=C8S4L3_9RHOB|nr:OpgC domain-containing protein [Rhodobacter sp. SW2]EEW24096.1 OpgC protein [Rhodobacter sp. SW2]
MLDTYPAAKGPSARDLRLDVFRGLCLVMIFMNHIPGTVYENLTSRNFGFSDAAEGFVLMSGVAAGLAYSAAFRAGFTWQAVGRVWRRAWTLYMVHAVTMAAGLGILSYGALNLGTELGLNGTNFGTLLKYPLATHVGIPLLSYQIGYVNILPLYMVMLLAAPVMLWLALRRPLLLWALSGAVWVVAGVWYWDLPNYPNAGGWFFNPISWQVIFCTGLLIGVLLKSGKRLVPVLPWLQVLTGLFLLLAAVATQIPAVAGKVGYALWQVQDLGVPTLFTKFDKTYVSGPRLLHILALAYFLSSFGFVKTLSASPVMQPLALLGRNALPVFALGSMLALAGQVTKAALPGSLALDSALILGGLALQLAFAWGLEKGKLRH